MRLHIEDSFIYLQKPKQEVTALQAQQSKSVYLKHKLESISKTQPAYWSPDSKMIYIQCKISDASDAPARAEKSRIHASKYVHGHTLVPLASFMFQRMSRWKLINSLFHQSSKNVLAKSLLGSFDIHKRDLLAQIAPSKPQNRFPDEDGNVVVEEAD